MDKLYKTLKTIAIITVIAIIWYLIYHFVTPRVGVDTSNKSPIMYDGIVEDEMPEKTW